VNLIALEPRYLDQSVALRTLHNDIKGVEEVLPPFQHLAVELLDPLVRKVRADDHRHLSTLGAGEPVGYPFSDDVGVDTLLSIMAMFASVKECGNRSTFWTFQA
jgi:hypothetical protein